MITRFSWQPRHSPLLVGLLLILSFSAAYGKTKLVSSWKSPAYSGQRFGKILVIGVSGNPKIRADFEDAMAAKVGREGVEAVAGNSILLRPDAQKLDIDYVKTQVRDNQIDAVILTRLVKVDTQVTRISGHNYVVPYPYYSSLWGYYGTVYAQVQSPDYLREDTTVRIETNLYSTGTPDGELIWTGTTDTFNPKSAEKVIAPLVKSLVSAMEADGVLK
jgi:hypothetical protein